MANPLVSIGIPTRNRVALLKESLRTICAQTYQPLEILISDDASTDETEQFCRQLAETDPRIRYVRQPVRLGLYPNHNFCLDECRGEFLCLYHDDDQHHPQLISDSVAFLLRHPEVGIVCSDWDLLDEAGNQVGVREHNVPDVMPGLDYINRTIRLGQSFIGCPGAVIRRSSLGNVRFRLDCPIGFADFVIWFQIAERASIGHIPRRLWRYRLHKQSYSRRSIESLTHDYYENMNRYCDEHLQRWPEHADLVSCWRKDIDRYLFWALLYELGLHFRKLSTTTLRQTFDRSVYEISDYSLTPEEVQRVQGHLRRFCSGPLQVTLVAVIQTMLHLKFTWPLVWMVQHAGSVRRVLGFK